MARPPRRLARLLVLASLVVVGCTADPSPEAAGSADPPAATDADTPEPSTDDEPLEPDVDDAPDGARPAAPADDDVAQPERDHPYLHGAWIHLFDDTLKTRAGIDAAVDELADAGATAIVAQVIRRHDAYYDSEVLPRTADPALAPDLDALQELLDAAHARGIQVHAWLSVAPTWHDTYEGLPAPEGWLATTHGHLAGEADRWVTRDVDGAWSQYLDPALPEVRAHVVEVVRELVTRYAVDGIHLDYVRYESARHGYHPRAVADYLDETGTSRTPAPDDLDWSQWRRDRTRELIAEVAAMLDAEAPDVSLSAAAISWGSGPGHADTATFSRTRSYTDALQDWEGWVRDGLLDAVMPMTYFRDHDEEQRGWFTSWVRYLEQLAGEVDVAIVPGIAGWLNTSEATLSQAVTARRVTDGVLVYSYQQPTEDGSRTVWPALRGEGWGTPVR